MTDNKPWEIPADSVCNDTEVNAAAAETKDKNIAAADPAPEAETPSDAYENNQDSDVNNTSSEINDKNSSEEAKASIDVPSANDEVPDQEVSLDTSEQNIDSNAYETKDESSETLFKAETDESIDVQPASDASDEQTNASSDVTIDNNPGSTEPDGPSSTEGAEALLSETNESAEEATLESEFLPDSVIEPKHTINEADADDRGVSASISNDPSDWAEDASADEEDSSAEKECEEAPALSDEDEDEDEADEDIDFNQIRIKLMALQHEIQVANIPVVIVFEGWDTAGKGTLVSKLIEGLDPRGYQVYPIRKPSEEHSQFPQMHRYWTSTPKQGNISIYCGSWYREVANACFEDKIARKHLQQSYNHIINLESQLVCDGVIMIKFFLHIPRKEQKKRLKKLDSKKSTSWRVSKDDWEQNAHYEEYLRLYDAMIARTHFDRSLWHVIRSDSKRACMKQIFDTVTEAFETALAERAHNQPVWDLPFLPHLDGINLQPFPQLDMFDPDQALNDPYKPAIDKAQKRLRKLQNELYRRGIPMTIGFEGWDAAGKGGAIRRLTSALDARGFDVVPIAAPTTLEKSHHYLWRFWREVPRNGHIAIFDRTWYGRVMVERIENLCTTAQWKRAYEEINRFESELVAHGVLICKFWLHIDMDTQLARFRDREADPEKQWKITDEDWRNREKWPLYEEAVNDMLQKTNTAFAPWTVVAGNNKQYARLKVLQTVINTIEARLQNEK